MRKWVPPIKSPPFNQTTIKGQGGYPMELTSKDIQLSIQVGKSYYITFCGELKDIEEKSRSSIRKVVGNARTEVYVERVEYNREHAELKCPCCGSRKAKYLRQVKERWVWYADINDIAVMVGFRAGRWKCSSCGRTYNDYPLGVMSYSRHSMIMMISVLKSLKKESIESVCRKYHIDHKTIPKKVKKKISVASTDLNAAYWRVLKEWKKDIKIIETRPTFTPSIRSTKTDH